MSVIRTAFLSVATLMLFAAATLPAAATSQDEAIAFVEDVVQDTLALAENGTVEEVDALFERVFAVDRISRFVVGRAYRSMSDNQKAEYQSAFRPYAVGWIHSELFSNIGIVEDYKIQRAIEEKRGERLLGYMVVSSFKTTNHGLTDIQWRLRDIDGELKIVDIIVMGVSISISQQTFFQNTIQNNGGVEGLIDFLRDASS